MTENDPQGATRPPTTPGGPMSERMQALLSRAAEEQLTEQRQVSAVLTDLRTLVKGIVEQVSGTASSALLEGLGGDVASLATELETSTAGLEERLDALGERLSAIGDAAGGVPAVARDLARVSGRVEELSGVRDDVAALRGEVEDVSARVAAVAFPTTEAVSAAVGQQVTDQLVDELAPRVADVVLTRVAATLVEQVAGSVTASVQNGLAERVRAANADTERRISAHVDEAVLVLAEALLRRRSSRSGASAMAGLFDLEPTVTAPALTDPAAPADEPRAPIVEPTPDLDEDVEEPVLRARPEPSRVTPGAAPPPTPSRYPEEWDDDEDADGSPRRPWWRPGG